MLSIPLGANRRLCLGTVWATLSATSQDDDVNPSRVGAVALRLVKDQDVLAASFTGLGGAMAPKTDDALFTEAGQLADAEREKHCLQADNDNLKDEVVALQDQTVLHLPSEADWLRAQLQELKSQPVAELPPVEDDYEETNDIETMSERQLMGMSFD